MKTRNQFFGLIAMAIIAIIALPLAGCNNGDNGNNNPETFTVTYHANGGTPEPAQQTIEKGKTATEPPAMTKTNSDFDGWYKESGFTTKWNFATDTVTTNIDLYAKWETYYGTLPNTTIKIYKGDATITDAQMTTAIADITTAINALTSEQLTIIKNNVKAIKVIGSGYVYPTFTKEADGKYVIEMKNETGPSDMFYTFTDIVDEVSGS